VRWAVQSDAEHDCWRRRATVSHFAPSWGCEVAISVPVVALAYFKNYISRFHEIFVQLAICFSYDDIAMQCYVLSILWTTSCLHTVGQAIPTQIGRVVGVANQGQHGFHTAGSKTDMMTSSTIFILQCAKTLAHIWRYSCDKAVRRRKGRFSTVRGIFSYSVQ